MTTPTLRVNAVSKVGAARQKVAQAQAGEVTAMAEAVVKGRISAVCHR